MAEHPGLWMGEELRFPPDFITETALLIAKRGSGKTYAASVLVEEMVGAGLPVCVLDPIGVWWGLRSSADGQGPGLPVIIIGGEHADLPLPADGAMVADLVIDERVPVVIDLSELSKTRQRSFVCAFLEKLYHRNREPLHVVVDEADLFAPLRGGKDTMRLLGAYEDIVRRGRARGLGCTSITQRPAVLHTDIRSQAEVLIALRLIGTHDVAAIDEWVRLHATDEEAKAVKASLPSLPVGTAWVWSPGWLELLVKVKIRQRLTFDSSATPKVGQQRIVPRSFARVDQSELDRMAGRLAPAPAEAPAQRGRMPADQARDMETGKLRVLVADLRQQLAEAQARPAEQIEVPVLAPGDVAALEQLLTGFRDAADRVELAIGRAHRPATPAPPPPRPAPVQAAPPPAVSPAQAYTGPAELKPGARRVLQEFAARHPLQVTRPQLATLAGMKRTGGAFQEYWSSLKRAGYIAESGGKVHVTAEGLAAAGVQPGSGGSLRDIWGNALKPSEWTMLEHLLDAYPAVLTREEIAERMSMTARGGAFQGYLSTLRSNDLVVASTDGFRAADVFFEGAAR